MSQDLEIQSPPLDSAPLPSVLPVDAPDAVTLPQPQPDDLRPQGFTIPQPSDSPLTPQSFSNVPFANLPLYLPTLTNPVVGYNGGLNAAALAVAGQGVICTLLPYLLQAEGDFIELHHNGTRADFHTVTEDEASKGKQITLYVESGRFVNQASNQLQAFVTRIGGGTDQTAQFNILVDTDRPGGPNPASSTHPNENLPLPRFPQQIIDFGVDQNSANQPIPVLIDFYPVDRSLPATHYRKVRDRIRLSIGGIIVEHVVTEFEAASEDPITITVNPGVWPQAGGGVKRCEYDVVDEVGNRSQGFSPAQNLDVRLDNSTDPFLPAAFIFESDDDGTGNDFLDYDALEGADATIAVSVRSMGYQANDIIRVRVNGLTQEGVRIIKFYDFSVTSTTVIFAFIYWPNADIRPLVGGRIQITYQRIRNGVPAHNSESALLAIVGTPIDTSLPAPLVVDAIGGVLQPTVDPIFVEVFSYVGQNANDRVTLVIEGTYANGRPYYAEYSERAGLGDIYFEIPNGPNGDIAQLQGGRAKFYYLINNGVERPRSNAVTVDIGDFQASLPAPVPRQAPPPGYVFDPEVSKGNLNVTVTRHAAFVVGAIVTLHFEGSAVGGSIPPDRFPIDSSWVGQDLPFTIARVYVLANLNGTGKLYYTVEVPGQRTLISHDIVLKIGSALNLPVARVLEGTVITPTLTRLNPEHVLPPRPAVVTFRVSYSPMLSRDNVKLRVIGGPGLGTPDIASKPGIAEPGEDYISFTVSNRFVGASLGTNCQVFYEVERDGAITTSDVLTLEVQSLPAQELDLVSIPEAASGVVETSKTYTVRVDGWPFMQQGQHVWIDVLSSSDRTLRAGVVVSAAEFSARRIQVAIPADYLRSLHDGDGLTVRVLVSLDGTGDRSTTLPLTLSPVYRVKKASGVVDGEIAVGNTPNHLALSSDNSTLYVANYGSKTVSVIDTATRKVTRTINLTSAPSGIAIHPNGQTLYVASENYQVIAIETENFQIVATILTPYGYFSALHLNPTGSRLYAGNDYYPYIFEIDTTTNKAGATLVGSSYSYSRALTTNRSGSRIYTSGYNINVFNQSTGALLGSYYTGGESTGLAYSPTEEVLYATLFGSTATDGSLRILSTTTTPPALIKTLGNLSHPWGVAFAPNGEKAYMCLYADNSIKIIDTATQLITGEINTTTYPLDRPKEIVITSDGSLAYVANSGNNNVIIVSL